MKKRKQKKNSKSVKGNNGTLLFKVIMSVLFLSGLFTFSYPFLSDAINDFHDQITIEKYQKQYSSLTQYQKKQRKKEMEAKNEELLKNNKLTNIPGMGLVKDPFEDTTKDVQDPGKEYFKTHMIGAIFIPKIKVSLPIFDKTNDALLDKGITVLQGTSFPIGGKGTHSVLTGHTGLPEKKLFTDLDKLKKGDLFYINISGNKLAYKINHFKTVLPNKLDDLKIVDGIDQVTLVTCTPYMVNTHRLLVTGIRVPYREKKLEKEVKATQNYHKYRIIIFIFFILLILLIIIYMIWRTVHKYLKKS